MFIYHAHRRFMPICGLLCFVVKFERSLKASCYTFLMQYAVIDSYVRHCIPFVRTAGVVTEGHDNHMRGYMRRVNFYTYRVEGDLVNSHGSAGKVCQ